jgi:hypothetical protein
MSREESSYILEQIFVTSRALVELDEPEAGHLCEALRVHRRELLARLSKNTSSSEKRR